MTRFFYRAFRAAQYLKLTRNLGAIRIISRHPKLDLSLLQPSETGPEVLIKGTDVVVTRDRNHFLLRGLDCVGRLVREGKAAFREMPDGVLLDVQGVKLKLENWEELFIASEVFAENIYNVRTEMPFVLVDIGMNVGTTSLFFAGNPSCQAIYSFEPFPGTVEKAKVNLALNPSLAPKVNVTPSGVASRSFSTEWDYVPEYKGSIGLMGTPDYVQNAASADVRKVRVNCLDCLEVFSDVARKHSKLPIICKLDCEGAEYEILERLAEKEMLKSISVFMIEWHKKGAAPIEAVLQRHGFTVLSFSPNAPQHSMIYAWANGLTGTR